MSLQLLKDLNGKSNSGLQKFISQFESSKSEPRIAWYPSAYTDFRGLMYLHPKYKSHAPIEFDEPASPDIFLFTDYFPWQSSNFLDGKEIHDDYGTRIWVESIEELPSLQTSLDSQIINFPEGSSATNRVVFLQIKINSNVLGEISYPVIYAYAENESFCAEKLIPQNTKLSHVIFIRYGGGCGGGGHAGGIWILNVLKKLHCEVFVTDGSYREQEGDMFAMEKYPELKSFVNLNFQTIRKVRSQDWSHNGDVKFQILS